MVANKISLSLSFSFNFSDSNLAPTRDISLDGLTSYPDSPTPVARDYSMSPRIFKSL